VVRAVHLGPLGTALASLAEELEPARLEFRSEWLLSEGGKHPSMMPRRFTIR
jgi:hypothetical protein